ncbi:MAG: hypothetical protein M3394_06215 [Actinomycetota bacterium]|nr:hypothetical protein [Actinomycetota bacterium]
MRRVLKRYPATLGVAFLLTMAAGGAKVAGGSTTAPDHGRYACASGDLVMGGHGDASPSFGVGDAHADQAVARFVARSFPHLAGQFVRAAAGERSQTFRIEHDGDVQAAIEAHRVGGLWHVVAVEGCAALLEGGVGR